MNTIPNKKTRFVDLDLIAYQKAWDYQGELFNQTLSQKARNRDLPADQQLPTGNHVIFCQHPHVFTLGKSGDEKNLLISKDHLHTIQASYFSINRGGDITYHGPGQIVGYPILDLENFFTDIHKYMRALEEAVIQTLAHFEIKSGRVPGLTGVWIDSETPEKARKICALGVKTSRWVTMHGFAFNINTDLRYFDYIVPCGIQDKAVTSMEKETGKTHDVNKVTAVLKQKIGEQFGLEWI
jgi:lipoyl(octanoyl) transferase